MQPKPYRAPALMWVALSVLAMIPVSAAAQNLGESLYKTKCTLCHGADGSGTTLGKKMKARDLRSPEVQKQTDEELIAIITNGKNSMPPFKAKLSPEHMPQVLGHIRELAKKK
jgi:cytochrome c6